MSGRKRFLFLLGILTLTVVGAGSITMVVLYDAAFEQQRVFLIETAESQTQLIESIARFDDLYIKTDVPGGAAAATISQLRDANLHFKGFGKTGEFTLAKIEGDSIIFLLNHRHHDLDNPHKVSFTGAEAEPMQRALSGKRGTTIGLDYRGEMVLAAFVPVAVLNLGLVVKMDLAEIRAPFVRAGILAGCGAMLLVILGSFLFLRIGMPLVLDLEESEKKYRQLFSSEPDAIILFDAKTLKCLDANPAALELYGYNLEELLDLNLQDLSAELDKTLHTVAKIRIGDIKRITNRLHKKKDGTVFPIEISACCFTLGSREIMCGIGKDITERKQAEEKLKESEAKYRAIVDNALDGIVLIDVETRQFVQFNFEAHNNLGYSREEFQKMTIADVEANESPDEVAEHIETILRYGSDKFETQFRTKTGELIDMMASVTSISLQGRQYLSSMWRDITIQKRADKMRQQQHEFLQNVIDSLGHPFYVINPTDYTIKLANKACKKMGFEEGITCHRLFHGNSVPCDGIKQPCPMRQVIATGQPITVEHQHLDKQGKSKYSQISTFPLFDSENNVSDIIVYTVDITERKLAEVTLMRSEERFRTVIEQAGDAFYLTNTSGRFIDANQRACETLGYTRDELLKLAVSDIDPNLPGDKLTEFIQALQPGKPITLETIHRRNDGTTFPVEIRVAQIEISGSICIIALVRDITERKAAETALTASLEEKEILLKEIHHRVKNNLQIISSLLRIQSDYTDDLETISVLEASQSRVNSMALIHEQLYQSSNLGEIDFKEYIHNLTDRMQQSYGENARRITIEVSIKDVYLSIETAIPCGLIVSELLSNAFKHAFPEGRDGEICISHKSSRNRSILTVSDTGVGIPPEVDIKNSSSLGLQLVSLLAKQLGGSIEMKLEEGTSISLVYPQETASPNNSSTRAVALENT